VNLDALPGELGLLALETSRIGGLFAAAPLPWKEAPMRVRAALVIALAVVAHGPAGTVAGPATPAQLIFAVPTEVIVGVAMGIVVSVVMSSAQVAADSIGPLFGLGIPSVFDPQTSSQSTVLVRIFTLMMSLLAVLVGVHRVVVASVLASFRVLPPGSVADPSVAALPLIKMAGEAMAQGMRLALPLAAILLLTQVALAFLSRAAPAMQIFSVGFALSLAVGTAVLVFTLPDIGAQMIMDLSGIGSRIEVVVASMMGR
jgi:flagellar biosynthetic protein FliR